MPTEKIKPTVKVCKGTPREVTLVIPGIAAINAVEPEHPANVDAPVRYRFSVVMQGLTQVLKIGGFSTKADAQREIEVIEEAAAEWHNAHPRDRDIT